MEHTNKKTFLVSCVCVLFLSLMMAMPQISYADETSGGEASAGASTEVSIWQEKVQETTKKVSGSLPKTGDDVVLLAASVAAVGLTSGVLAVVAKRGVKNDKD